MPFSSESSSIDTDSEAGNKRSQQNLLFTTFKKIQLKNLQALFALKFVATCVVTTMTR